MCNFRDVSLEIPSLRYSFTFLLLPSAAWNSEAMAGVLAAILFYEMVLRK